MKLSNPATKPKPELPPIRTNIEEAKRDLTEHGMTRFFGAATEEEIKAALIRVLEQAAGEDAHECAYHEEGISVGRVAGGANQRVWNLVNKGEIFRRLMMNPVVLTLMRHLLGEDILLFNLSANIARKGGLPMKLHADQTVFDTPYPLMVNCVWMLQDFTEENGATLVVPGSHKLARQPKPDDPVETVPLIGSRGTIVLFEGRLWHGTGVNLTDEPRCGLLAPYCKVWHRQQEHFTMSVAPEVLEACSEEQLTLLGFRTYKHLGMVDGLEHGALDRRPRAFSRELRP